MLKVLKKNKILFTLGIEALFLCPLTYLEGEMKIKNVIKATDKISKKEYTVLKVTRNSLLFSETIRIKVNEILKSHQGKSSEELQRKKDLLLEEANRWYYLGRKDTIKIINGLVIDFRFQLTKEDLSENSATENPSEEPEAKNKQKEGVRVGG